MVADFVILYVKEREDEDFLELPFEKSVDAMATRITRVQIWIYVILNVSLTFVLKELSYDKDYSD